MVENNRFPWMDLLNGAGSILIALLVVILVSVFTPLGSLGPLGFVVLFAIGVAVAAGLLFSFRHL